MGLDKTDYPDFKVLNRDLIKPAIAAERIQSYIVRRRLEAHPTAMKAYQKGGMVTAEINAILAEEFCQELLAPVNATYEDEKARILGDLG